MNSKLSSELLWNEVQKNEIALTTASTNNTGALVRDDTEYSARRLVSWISGVTNVDSVVFTLPARSLLKNVLIIIEVPSTNGAGLTTSTLSLGTTVGGAELLDATAAQALAANALIGNTLTELGPSLPTTTQGVYFPAAQNINLRIANAGGAVGVTAGSFSVYLEFKVLHTSL